MQSVPVRPVPICQCSEIALCSVPSQAKNRLCGDGSLALCIWIAERRMTQEPLAVHECTSAFDSGLFSTYLPMYEIIQPKDDNSRVMHLSPHLFGWPMYRPRLYTVLCHRSKCGLSEHEFTEVLKALMCRPTLDVHQLFVADALEVKEQRKVLSQRLYKAENTPFAKLLTGAKGAYLDGYRSHPRVKKYFEEQG
eukprot:s5265_g3.t1